MLLLCQSSHSQYKVACKKINFEVFVLWLWSCILFRTSLETADLVKSIKEDYLCIVVNQVKDYLSLSDLNGYWCYQQIVHIELYE